MWLFFQSGKAPSTRCLISLCKLSRENREVFTVCRIPRVFCHANRNPGEPSTQRTTKLLQQAIVLSTPRFTDCSPTFALPPLVSVIALRSLGRRVIDSIIIIIIIITTTLVKRTLLSNVPFSLLALFRPRHILGVSNTTTTVIQPGFGSRTALPPSNLVIIEASLAETIDLFFAPRSAVPKCLQSIVPVGRLVVRFEKIGTDIQRRVIVGIEMRINVGRLTS